MLNETQQNLDSRQQEVALFPIPNLVAFPGTVVPLHVFEPRYRQLVKDCLEQDRLLGVCHTQKTIRDAPRNQSPAEMLSTNQATYQPQDVFSAGPCKLIETTPDGRLLAEIHIEQRFVIKQEIQTLPYRIVACEILDDETEAEAGSDELMQQILKALVPMIARQNPEIAVQLRNTEMPAEEFSFKVFQYLRLEPDVMQSILESRSPRTRLEMIWQIIQQA